MKTAQEIRQAFARAHAPQNLRYHLDAITDGFYKEALQGKSEFHYLMSGAYPRETLGVSHILQRCLREGASKWKWKKSTTSSVTC